jgi:hypothetical protein
VGLADGHKVILRNVKNGLDHGIAILFARVLKEQRPYIEWIGDS